MVNLQNLQTRVQHGTAHQLLRMNDQGDVQITSGSLWGRALQWGSPQSPQDNRRVIEALTRAMQGEYGEDIANSTKPLIKDSRPLSARDVQQWIDAADKAKFEFSKNAAANIQYQYELESLGQQLLSPALSDEDHCALKLDFITLLSKHFSDEAVSIAGTVVDFSAESRWNELDIHRLCMTVQELHGNTASIPATSNRGTAHYGDSNRLGDTHNLGAGSTNTVSLGQWQQATQTQDKVFKPITPESTHNFDLHGIQVTGNGNIAGRNVAAAEIAHAMGLGSLITVSHHATHNGGHGIVMDKAQGQSITSPTLTLNVPQPLDAGEQAALNFLLAPRGLEIATTSGTQLTVQVKDAAQKRQALLDQAQHMLDGLNDFATSPDAYLSLTADGFVHAPPNANPDHYLTAQSWLSSRLTQALEIKILPVDGHGNVTDGTLNLALNQLQWLDFICGQADRNLGNVFVQYDAQGNVSGITGIDNDLSFGEQIDDQHRIAKFQGLPTAIDAQTAAAIRNMHANTERLQTVLRSNGLTEAEVDQTLHRLAQAVQAIAGLQAAAAPNPASSILPANPQQWTNMHQDGYSRLFASVQMGATTLNPSDLYNLLPQATQLHQQHSQHLHQLVTELQATTPTGAGVAITTDQLLTLVDTFSTLQSLAQPPSPQLQADYAWLAQHLSNIGAPDSSAPLSDAQFEQLHALLERADVTHVLPTLTQAMSDADQRTLLEYVKPVETDNQRTLSSHLHDKAALAKFTWSPGLPMAQISSYQEFLQHPKTTATDIATLRQMAITAPAGSPFGQMLEALDPFEFDDAVSAIRTQAPTPQQAIALFKDFVVQANSNTGFSFDVPAPRTPSTGPKEINVGDAAYQKARQQVSAQLMGLLHQALVDTLT